MAGKRSWPRPAAWAIAQNERLWQKFDSVAERSVVVDWSLGDSYRTKMMDPGDRAVFWITGRNGGIARIGFVLKVKASPGGYWEDSEGKRHKSPYTGLFFMPPLPNRRYIHRDVLIAQPELEGCELLGTSSQMQAPLRIELHEWKVIERLLLRFDRTNIDFRSAWEG